MEDEVTRTELVQLSEMAEHLRTHIGIKERAREKDTYASLAAEALVMANGTIMWDGADRCPFGYESIWQYIAGTYHPEAVSAKPLQKAERAQEHAHKYQLGFTALDAKTTSECGWPLIKVPALKNGRSLVCITVDPTIKVNAAGDTARDVFVEREKRRVAGQVKATMPRLESVLGESEARIQLGAATFAAIGTAKRIGSEQQSGSGSTAA